eukprot:scaffold119851_cov48-Phaeocystis_antarctica.AAC.1
MVAWEVNELERSNSGCVRPVAVRLRRPTFRRPAVGEAARDGRCTREAAPGDVHVTADAVSAVLHPAAGRSRARTH